MKTSFKAIRCWLRLDVSKKAPKGWSEKRMRITDRITALARNSGGSATLEELPVEPTTKANDNSDHPKACKKGRLELSQRYPDLEKVKQYNMLAKKDDNMINDWKSYPGLAPIINMAREIIETGEKMQIEKLTKLMQGHESQQFAPLITTIAILIGEKVNLNNLSISKECSRAIGDMIIWDTPVVTSRDTWPSRYHYSFMQIFSDPKEKLETKTLVHGYLGNKASREMKQF